MQFLAAGRGACAAEDGNRPIKTAWPSATVIAWVGQTAAQTPGVAAVAFGAGGKPR